MPSTAAHSFAIGVGGDGNPTSRKGSPVNFDRCRLSEVTVLTIARNTNGGGRSFCSSGVGVGDLRRLHVSCLSKIKQSTWSTKMARYLRIRHVVKSDRTGAHE